MADRRGRLIAVNQQLRYDGGIAAGAGNVRRRTLESARVTDHDRFNRQRHHDWTPVLDPGW